MMLTPLFIPKILSGKKKNSNRLKIANTNIDGFKG